MKDSIRNVRYVNSTMYAKRDRKKNRNDGKALVFKCESFFHVADKSLCRGT